ncbi:MAG: hypothetical protein AAF533_25175 [Acidobacteriota bacterium]
MSTRWLTIGEASKRVGVSPSTIRRAIQDGKLTAESRERSGRSVQVVDADHVERHFSEGGVDRGELAVVAAGSTPLVHASMEAFEYARLCLETEHRTLGELRRRFLQLTCLTTGFVVLAALGFWWSRTTWLGLPDAGSYRLLGRFFQKELWLPHPSACVMAAMVFLGALAARVLWRLLRPDAEHFRVALPSHQLRLGRDALLELLRHGGDSAKTHDVTVDAIERLSLAADHLHGRNHRTSSLLRWVERSLRKFMTWVLVVGVLLLAAWGAWAALASG